jgi:cytoskeletal protein CcmA (bactofilin family)
MLSGVATNKRMGDNMKNKKEISFLGEDTEFEGKLIFKDELTIFGHFKGEILTEGTLVIGESALVEADIHAFQIIIHGGEVRGNIVADKKIVVYSPGKVLGTIQTPAVIIEEGVTFEGSCSMRKIDNDDNKNLAVVT